LPIRTDQAISFAASLLHSAGSLERGEMLVFQLVVYPVGSPTSRPTEPLGELKVGPGWLQTAAHLMTVGTETTPRDKKALRAKAAEPVFGVAGRVGAASANRGRSRHLVGRSTGTLHQLAQPGVGFMGRVVGAGPGVEQLARAATPIGTAPMHLNARELAT